MAPSRLPAADRTRRCGAAAAVCVVVFLAAAAGLSQAPLAAAAPRRRAKHAGSLWKALRRECEVGTCAVHTSRVNPPPDAPPFILGASAPDAAGATLGGSAPANRDDWYIVGACVDHCAAPSCYAAVYGAEPLEPGEVNRARAMQYSACVRRLETDLRGRNLWPPRRDAATGVLQEAGAEPAPASPASAAAA